MYTKGKWYSYILTGKTDKHIIASNQGKDKIAELGDKFSSEEINSNAFLISAAPQLYESLESLIKTITKDYTVDLKDQELIDVVSDAQTAINKAKGK